MWYSTITDLSHPEYFIARSNNGRAVQNKETIRGITGYAFLFLNS